MVAIKGAFSAGLVSGFGKAFTKTMEDNWKRYDKHIDQNLDLARSLAPDFAKSTAEAQQQLELSNTMQSEFGLTDAEVVAIGQNYDLSKVYTEFLKHQQGLPQGVQVRKEDLLSILDIKKGDVLELPDGMTKEDALTAINLGYAKNVATKPGDKSEAHKNRSWAKAVSDVLMLNPKVSAEQAVQQMTTMGIPVEDILLYQAAQTSGKSYKPMNIGMAAGDLGSLATDYNEESYGKTKRAFATALTKQYFPGSDGDLANVTDATLTSTADILAKVAEGKPDATKLRKAVGQLVNKGGSAFAKLENDILVSGYYDGFNRKSMREMALMSISDQIDTREKLDKFMAAVENGSLAAAIVSAGGATDEVIEALFNTSQGDDVNRSIQISPLDMTGAPGERNNRDDLEATQEVSYDTSGTPSFRDRRTVAPEVDTSLKNAGIVSGLITPEANTDTIPAASPAIEEKISAPTVQNLNDSFDDTEEKNLSVEDQAEKRYQAVQSFLDEASTVAGETTETAMQAVANVVDIVDRAALEGTFKVGTKLATAAGATAQHMGYEDTAKALYKWSITNKDSGTTAPLLTQQINDLLDNIGVPDFSEGINLPSPDSEMGGAGSVLGAIPLADMTADFIRSLNQEESAEVLVQEIFDNVAAMSDEEKAAKIEELKAVAATLKEPVKIPERGFDTEANQGLLSYIRAAERRAFKPTPEEEPKFSRNRRTQGETTDLGDLSGAPGFREEPSFADAIMSERSVKREPELLSYEVWKDMSKAERASVGLDLPLVSIQNRVRSGSIPLPRGKSLPTPLRMKQERYLAASTESGTLPQTSKPDALMTKPTKQNLTAPTVESGVAVERTTGASKALADLRTTFNRIHGKKSKTVKQFEKVLQQAQSGTPIQYTDVNLLLRATRSLPKTKTRDELAKKLYDIAQGLR